MGKKSKLKAIRRIAASMPVIEGERKVTHRVMGASLIEEFNTKTLPSGTAIEPNAIYRETRKEKVEVNHERRMKLLYNRYGSVGVDAYMKAVAEYADEQSKTN
jgi:hypothetical protein